MIIVTGATGHIGNVLIRKLTERGEKVGIITNSSRHHESLKDLNYTLFEGDIRDLDFLRKVFSQAETVYHLAGLISIMPGTLKQLEAINLRGTLNVLQACKETGVKRLVYTSSTHTLKELPKGTPLTEIVETNLDIVDGDYAKSKIKATLAVFEAAKQGLDVVVVFPSGVIGPFDFKPSETGKRLLTFIKGYLRFHIDGMYNFVDVRDVANGLIAAMEKGVAGEGYILSGYSITVKEMFELSAKGLGKNRTTIPFPFGVAYSSAIVLENAARVLKFTPTFTTYALRVLRSNPEISFEKAHNALGYQPRPLHESFVDIIKWFQGHPVSLD